MPKKKTIVIKETDADIEDVEEESVEEKGEVNIGSYKLHLETAKNGIEEFHIWDNLTAALIHMAEPNTFHRIDLRDKETLQKLAKDMNMEIDFDYIKTQIHSHPVLIQANGT